MTLLRFIIIHSCHREQLYSYIRTVISFHRAKECVCLKSDLKARKADNSLCYDGSNYTFVSFEVL